MAAVHQLEESGDHAALDLSGTARSTRTPHLDMFIDDERLERKLFELTADTRTTGYSTLAASSFVGVDRGRPKRRGGHGPPAEIGW